MSSKTIYTVGHSTRQRSELAALLKHYGVDRLIDIRAIPYSRYNPQFNLETMMEEFPKTGIEYEHLAVMGGERPSSEVMAKAKSCSERSRGFAAHMESEEFRQGLDYVLDLAAEGKTIALMCGELRPEHCHRFQVADVIQGEGWEVEHIVSEDDLRHHPANLFTY